MARKILLADDSVTAQNMGRKILADAGYEVVTVNNGSAALKKINEQRPDVIVLDVYMPGYSGLEVCQRLKETGETSRIPILLTVGKLEPFKPEEARRVRADGFIVKPFEASELLSALTRLEDKIVPRHETTKSGRFSRAMSSMDDPRLDRSVPFDKTMAMEEDAGWKNRIAFPTKGKKREPELEEPAEQPTQVSRSAVEKMPDEVPRPSAALDQKVDVSALAPAGLPKDVTPEEIAALAAAAARMKGKFPAPEMPVVAPAESQSQKSDEESFVESARLIQTPDSVVEPMPQIKEPQPATTSADQVATSGSKATPVDQLSVPENEDKPLPEEEPVTMAAAAAAAYLDAPSRWTAVSVALTPEETGISLEQEMQKAYAAYEAAESGHSSSAALIPNEAAEPPLSPSPDFEVPTSASVPAIKAPEEVQPLAAVASVATEAVTAAVRELENVASAFVQPEHRNVAAPESNVPSLSTEVAPAEVVQQTAKQPTSEVGSDLQAVPEAAAHSESAEPRDEVLRPTELSEASEVPSGAPELEKQGSTIEAESRQPESDVSSPTASAWANFQRIQEPGNDKPSAVPEIPQPVAGAQDKAAMAAAVGGKNALEELTAAAEDDPAIASIVDSVLADLRPKIVEEISRKLGKKK